MVEINHKDLKNSLKDKRKAEKPPAAEPGLARTGDKIVPDKLKLKKKAKPLGQKLMESGLITEAQLDLALRDQKRKGIFLGDALEQLGFLTQDVISSTLAEETKADIVDVKEIAVDPEVIKLVPFELAKRFQLLPLSRNGTVLTVAMADTFDVVAVDALGQATGMNLEIVSAPKQDVMDAIDRLFAQTTSIEEIIEDFLRKGTGMLDEELGREVPMIRLVDNLISMAVKKGATDIHVEPDEKILRIRMRLDGILHQEVLMPKALQAALTARIKIMAHLDITEKRLPQDGRITFMLGTREVDLRISTLPSAYGENIVMRVLDKESLDLTLPSLGFSLHNRELFEDVLKRPHGIILVTGPTGSGKTTTLYTALKMVTTLEKSIFTLEDPIEYRFPIVRQTQIRPDIGMDFARGLRALLRQDPDIMMVGEIRDAETAELAIRAALTGHMVFSTLHTNSAAGAIPRLVDMGAEPYLISSALACVMAQRLVRRICSNCRVTVKNPEKLIDGLGVNIPSSVPLELYKGAGCAKCKGLGYKTRVAIIEIIRLDDRYRELIVNKADSSEIETLARGSGFRTMLEDGIDKALQGITTVEEVAKAAK
ncbi:MAG: hypothetical protein IEMM0002_0265 [bacterium]|nr:MAG: hypothetical protein IEMM0002_0265 [bacterium]